MTNQVATTEKPRVPNVLESFRNQLEKQTPAFSAMLPAHVPVEKFKRVVMTAVINNNDILQCDAKSVLIACSRAAADGLLPDGREGAIVKFGGVAQWMPMTAGVLKKIRNSGELLSISAYVVYQKDRFIYRLGDDENIEHTPFIGDDAGDAIAVYAIAKTKDGGIYREVMTKAQVEKVRAVSRSKANGPWVAWWDEMAKKTVIRRLSKRLPMSTDKEEDIRAMLEREDDEMQDVTPTADAAPRPTREQFQDPAGAEKTQVDGGRDDDATGSAGNGGSPMDGRARPVSTGGNPGGDNVNAGKAEALTPGASDPRESMSPEERERVEREADRMQRGEDDGEGSAELAVDLSAAAVPMKGDKPDIAAYAVAVNAALAKVEAMTDLAEFDAANKPVATKIGGALLANYNLAVAQRRKAIGEAR